MIMPKANNNGKHALLLLILFMQPVHLIAADTSSQGQRAFFVAPQGHDDHPGTSVQPFATFQRAQQAVRAERRAHPDQGVTVTFLPGRYELQIPLEFTAEDSGSRSTEPVIYRAGAGAEVEICGGRRIHGWQPDPEHRNSGRLASLKTLGVSNNSG